MYNWSTDTTRLKNDPKAWEIFQLEQTVNFGLNNQKLSASSLRKYWDQLQLDPDKKKFLQTLLWTTS